MTVYKPQRAFLGSQSAESNDVFFHETKRILDGIHRNLKECGVNIIRQEKKDKVGAKYHMQYTATGCPDNPRLAQGEVLVLKLDRTGTVTLSHNIAMKGQNGEIQCVIVDEISAPVNRGNPQIFKRLCEAYIQGLTRLYNRRTDICIRDAVLKKDAVANFARLGPF
jgi:hypothetical protein